MQFTDFANFFFGSAITGFSALGFWGVKKIIKEMGEVKTELGRHNAQLEIILKKIGL